MIKTAAKTTVGAVAGATMGIPAIASTIDPILGSPTDPLLEYWAGWQKADWDYANGPHCADGGDIDVDHPYCVDASARCVKYQTLICETQATTRDGLLVQMEFAETRTGHAYLVDDTNIDRFSKIHNNMIAAFKLLV